MVLWRPIGSFRANTKKRCPFHHQVLECKSVKWRDTWSNRQVWPWNTNGNREKANRFFFFFKENALVIANTLFQQHKRWRSTWTSPDGQYGNQIDYIFAAEGGKNIQSAKTRLIANCDHELLISKFRLKLRKVGKITRPFRYDLNQISWFMHAWCIYASFCSGSDK